MAFVEVTDSQVIDDLARAQLLWHVGVDWAKEYPTIPFESKGEGDLPSNPAYMTHKWKFYILVEE